MAEKASLEARIQAEAIVKAACVEAAAQLIASGKLHIMGDDVEDTVAWSSMKIWAKLLKPDQWPG
jgi:hypothetical protein